MCVYKIFGAGINTIMSICDELGLYSWKREIRNCTFVGRNELGAERGPRLLKQIATRSEMYLLLFQKQMEIQKHCL